MAPTLLIVGATGNTGRSLVEALPSLVKKSKTLSNHRILCLTRSTSSDIAKKLAKLPGVEFAEKNWIEIDADWLKEHNVERVFVASHNEPPHFAEEGQFYLNCLHAAVKYVVRISTTHANVKPDFPAYYPRNHWAIEAMLSTPEFKALPFTSLQPNGFTPMVMASAAEFVKEYRKTGKQGHISLMCDKDWSTGYIDPADVGVFAAHLLALDDITPHENKKYNMNGPENIGGKEIIALVEKHIGTKVDEDKVAYYDLDFIDGMADAAEGKHSRNLILSIKAAPLSALDPTSRAEATDKEVLELYAPKRTPADVMEDLIKE